MVKKIIKFVSDPKTNYPNIYIFSYHALKAVHKFLVKAGLIKRKYLDKDMFNWSLYNLHYKGELLEEKKRFTIDLSEGDYQTIDNKLTKINTKIKPLSSNHRFLYETIMQLKPQSVFEMGCGTGINLHNLKTLLPQAKICGIDISNQQLNNLKKTYPDLSNITKQADATIPFNQLPYEICDIAFTQAVIMHIHTGNLHLVALENLFKMSKKYIVMNESPKNHQFKNDIQKLFDEGKIKWNKIFFYYRFNEEEGCPMGIICSSIPLNYPELTNYNILMGK